MGREEWRLPVADHAAFPRLALFRLRSIRARLRSSLAAPVCGGRRIPSQTVRSGEPPLLTPRPARASNVRSASRATAPLVLARTGRHNNSRGSALASDGTRGVEERRACVAVAAGARIVLGRERWATGWEEQRSAAQAPLDTQGGRRFGFGERQGARSAASEEAGYPRSGWPTKGASGARSAASVRAKGTLSLPPTRGNASHDGAKQARGYSRSTNPCPDKHDRPR